MPAKKSVPSKKETAVPAVNEDSLFEDTHDNLIGTDVEPDLDATPTMASPVVSTAPKAQGWFLRGEDGLHEKERQDAVTRMRKEKGVPRFRLKPGEGARIVFIDSEGFYINEHNLAIDGKFGNYFTCTKDFETCGCPVCDSGRNDKKAVLTGYYTIIDTREFTKRDGTKTKNTKVLYPAKSSVIKMLADKKKTYGTLNGLVFDVRRYTEKDPNCGISIDYVGRLQSITAKFGEGSDVPFDYEKVLAMPTPEEFKAIGLKYQNVVGSKGDVDAVTEDKGEHNLF